MSSNKRGRPRKSESDRCSVQETVWLSPQLKEDMLFISEQTDVAQGTLMREAIKTFIAHKKKFLNDYAA